MQGKVTIEPDKSGNVIRVSTNNPEYGYVRVTQESVAFTATGWVKNISRFETCSTTSKFNLISKS